MPYETLLKLSKYEQLLNVASELLKAKEWQKNEDRFLVLLEKALNLIDILLTDPKWQDNYYFLLKLREEIVKVYIKDQPIEDVLKIL